MLSPIENLTLSVFMHTMLLLVLLSTGISGVPITSKKTLHEDSDMEQRQQLLGKNLELDQELSDPGSFKYQLSRMLLSMLDDPKTEACLIETDLDIPACLNPSPRNRHLRQKRQIYFGNRREQTQGGSNQNKQAIQMAKEFLKMYMMWNTNNKRVPNLDSIEVEYL